jgi:hypothetical protein
MGGGYKQIRGKRQDRTERKGREEKQKMGEEPVIRVRGMEDR